MIGLPRPTSSEAVSNPMIKLTPTVRFQSLTQTPCSWRPFCTIRSKWRVAPLYPSIAAFSLLTLYPSFLKYLTANSIKCALGFTCTTSLLITHAPFSLAYPYQPVSGKAFRKRHPVEADSDREMHKMPRFNVDHERAENQNLPILRRTR